MLKTPPAPDAGTARAVPAARRTSAGRAHPGGAAPAAPPPAAQASARGAHTIALLRSQSLPALVQQEIERMIVAGDLPIGSKLNEVDVAAMLGASFQCLDERGRPQRGTGQRAERRQKLRVELVESVRFEGVRGQSSDDFAALFEIAPEARVNAVA